MKLLMENWREYVTEENERVILTEEELSELLQEIGALKSFMGRMRGGKKSGKHGYGWEAAVEQWEDEEALKAAQNLGLSGVDTKEDFVAKVQDTIKKAEKSGDERAKEAVKDLTADIEQTAEPETPETPEAPVVEPEEPVEEPLAPEVPTPGPAAPGETTVWGTINQELVKNDIQLADGETEALRNMLKSQSKVAGIPLNEASAWEMFKYWGAQLGRMEKGGKIIGRGKAEAENKAKIEKELSKPATDLIKNLRDKLEDEYPEFPNNKETAEFGMALVEIWLVYDSIVNGAKKGLMEPAAANALIRALYDLVDRYKNYELSDVGRHFTENVDIIDEKFGDRLRQVFQGGSGEGGIPSWIANPMAPDASAGARAAWRGSEGFKVWADARSELGINSWGPNSGEFGWPYQMLDRGADPETVQGFMEEAGLEIPEFVSHAAETGEFVKDDAMQQILGDEVYQLQMDVVRMQHDQAQALVQGGLEPEEAAKKVVDDLASSAASGDVPATAQDLVGQGLDSAPTGDPAGTDLVGRGLEKVADEELPEEVAQQTKEAVKQALEELPPETQTQIMGTMGTGATDLTGLQVAGFWLKAVALPAFLYSKIAIKLLRAKGKHSSRDRELTKLLDGIDEVPETSGFAGEETNIREMLGKIATIVDSETASALYAQLASELKRLGYEKMLQREGLLLLKEETIDLSNIKIPPEKYREVGLLLLKSLRPIGADINLGGELLNATELEAGTTPEETEPEGPATPAAEDAAAGVDLSAVYTIITDGARADKIAQIIYRVLISMGVEVIKPSAAEAGDWQPAKMAAENLKKENKVILERWHQLAGIKSTYLRN